MDILRCNIKGTSFMSGCMLIKVFVSSSIKEIEADSPVTEGAEK